MEREIIKAVKGFEFNRDVETKFGVLPMIATVTFTEVTEEEKAEIAKYGIESTTLMEVRTYISGYGKVEKSEIHSVNVDMNEETLRTFATDFVTKNQKANVEAVVVDMYIRYDSDFWSLFEAEDLPEPDMSEYAEEKRKYFDDIQFDMDWSKF